MLSKENGISFVATPIFKILRRITVESKEAVLSSITKMVARFPGGSDLDNLITFSVISSLLDDVERMNFSEREKVSQHINEVRIYLRKIAMHMLPAGSTDYDKALQHINISIENLRKAL